MQQKNKNCDPYKFHRTALVPVLPGATHEALERSCLKVRSLGESAFAQFLGVQGLAPLWDQCIAGYPDQLPVTSSFIESIHALRLQATGAYLIQRHGLDIVREALDGAGVTHVVMKGAHTREVYYDTPALRPAMDIDVLVHSEEKLLAIRAFQVKGFRFKGNPATISHEASLVKGYTSVDLHWDILRPGRTREPMTEKLIKTRVDQGSHWGLSPGATLFLMLVHPVFTKYSTAPQASLIRVIDMLLLLSRPDHLQATEQALQLLKKSGLNTAGWITVQWLEILTGCAETQNLEKMLQPRAWRRRWLQSWLEEDRASRLLDKSWTIQFGFTLPAHDRLSDALRAARQARLYRKNGSKALERLQAQLD
ncbi:MAG: nucleotidyltransferase family protein [Pseudomonadota bacterium]